MTLTTSAPQGLSVARPFAHRPGADRLQALRVTAVLVAHDGARWLPRTLAALAAQTRPVDHVVAVDTGSDDDSADLLRAALGAGRVHVVDRRTGFGAAVRTGLEQAPEAAAGDWVWLLHDDSAPLPDALEHLLDAAAASAQVGVVGPKLVSWDDPTRLVEAGVSVSRGGRRSSGVGDDERDQGQHDHRSDVLAVGTAGLLVQRDLYDRLGGFDPALRLLRDDVDLCWRAHLAGRRVVLAPRAVVADAQATTRGLRRVDAVRGSVRRTDRRHGLHVALARCSWPALPLVLVWLVVGGLVRSAGLLAGKAPRRAADELVATLAVALTPWTWCGSRWRARGTRSVRRRDVSSLLTPRLGFVRAGFERLGGLAARESPADEPALVAAESGPVADEADPVALPPVRWPRRLARHPMTAVLLAVTTTTALATATGRGGRSELVSPQGRPVELWQSAVDGWTGPGLGSSVAPPVAAVVRAAATAALAPIAGGAAPARAVDLLLLGGPLFAAISAYVATGLVARSRWARGWAALVWGTLPVLGGAVDAGRLGPVAATVLLPLVAAAVARTLSRRRAGSWRALCAAALGIAVLGAAVPVLLVAGLLVAAGGMVFAGGAARARAALLAVLPTALSGPGVLTLLDDPRRLLTGAGALVEGGPTAPLTAMGALVPLPQGWPLWAPAAIAGPLLIAGLAGLLRAGRVGRALVAVWALGLVGLATALLAPMVTVGRAAQAPLHPYAGTGLLLLALAAVAGTVAGSDGLVRRLAVHRFGWRQLLVAPLVAAAVLSPLAASVAWAWPGQSSGQATEPTSGPTTPAVAVDAATGPAALRTLVLAGRGGDITFSLEGREPAPWSRDLPATADPAVTRAVSLLLGPIPDLDPLRQLAVGFIDVRPDAPDLVATGLDTQGGLARLGGTGGTALWRVLQPTGRVTIAAGEKMETVPVTGSHAAVDTAIAAGPASRLLLLAEPADDGWRATLDGRRLAPVDDPGAPWRQAFALPASGGHLVVGHVDRRGWLVGQAALAAALALLAMPGLRREPATR